MSLIYIAHPLYGDGSRQWGDTARNFERYLRFVALATVQGHTVLSWAHYYMIHNRRYTDGDAAFYMDHCLALLDEAEEMWVCGPAAVSSGTTTELRHALEQGIPVVRHDDWADPTYWPDLTGDMP